MPHKFPVGPSGGANNKNGKKKKKKQTVTGLGGSGYGGVSGSMSDDDEIRELTHVSIWEPGADDPTVHLGPGEAKMMRSRVKVVVPNERVKEAMCDRYPSGYDIVASNLDDPPKADDPVVYEGRVKSAVTKVSGPGEEKMVLKCAPARFRN